MFGSEFWDLGPCSGLQIHVGTLYLRSDVLSLFGYNVLQNVETTFFFAFSKFRLFLGLYETVCQRLLCYSDIYIYIYNDLLNALF